MYRVLQKNNTHVCYFFITHMCVIFLVHFPIRTEEIFQQICVDLFCCLFYYLSDYCILLLCVNTQHLWEKLEERGGVLVQGDGSNMIAVVKTVSQIINEGYNITTQWYQFNCTSSANGENEV